MSEHAYTLHRTPLTVNRRADRGQERATSRCTGV